MLFLIYKNYIIRAIECTLVNLANYTKLGGLANSFESTKIIPGRFKQNPEVGRLK